MFKYFFIYLLAAMLASAAVAQVVGVDDLNLVWDTPSGDSSGSMPIGNGDIGANVWVEDNGDLMLLISKTDAWDANNMLDKIGRVRVSWSGAPFAKGKPFRQTLKLGDGVIEITEGDSAAAMTARVWVDANHPQLIVTTEGGVASEMTVRLELWRTAKRPITTDELNACREVATVEDGWVTPDVVADRGADRVVWYHRNETSVWADGMKRQGLESVMGQFQDPLMNRTFGAVMLGDGLIRTEAQLLKSAQPTMAHTLRIVPLTAQTDTAAAWLDAADALAARSTKMRRSSIELGDAWLKESAEPYAQSTAENILEAFPAHTAWWRAFWDRSWVRIGGNDDAQLVTRAYALQRWINACAGRGVYPIKFNGSIFTVEWRENGEVKSDPDFRRWGGAYWWQNTRLPYWPMLASGDYDLMQPVFKMYLDSLDLAKARNKIWFNCDGAVLAETMSSWGMYCNVDYGFGANRANVGEMENKYIRWIWSSGLDLAMMMLDYCEHTGDDAFLKEKAVPWADAMLLYFDTRFHRDADGKLLLSPTQSIETYQDGVTNDTPNVAGLRAVLPRLLALPETVSDATMRERWQRLLNETPELPVDKGWLKSVILPAKTYKGRANCENPELYPVFPFRLYGVGKPDLQLARDTFAARTEKSCFGWQQTGTQAASLGLADEARRILVENAKRNHDGSRFPAFWGPNYDWIPDQDHGGNLLNTLQTMLLQTDGAKILLFPAWPKDWDVSFKLHAPSNTTVEAVYRGGKVEALTVSPAERKADVTVMAAQ